MVYVEFTATDIPYPGARHYFVGATLGDVLADTSDGAMFGFINFSSHQAIPEENAQGLQLQYLQEGMDAVQNHECKSFMLGSEQTP